VVLQQVDSYLGYTGRGANPFGKAARDPYQTTCRLRFASNKISVIDVKSQGRCFEGKRMRRREFIAGTATIAFSFASRAHAQTNARSPVTKHIAIFYPSELREESRAVKAYFDELNKLGFVEGQNLIVERHSGLGQPIDRYGDFARQIVASHPDVIMPLAAGMVKEINALGTGIPMVAPTADPVPFGLSSNLARPDGNFTGVVIDSGLEIWAKRVQLLLEAARGLTKVGWFNANPNPPAPGKRSHTEYVREAARRSGIKMAFVVVGGKFDRAAYERRFPLDAVIVGGEWVDRAAYERTFDLMEKHAVDGIVVSDTPEHITYSQVIVDLAARFHVPAIYPLREFVEVGGLMAYGVDSADLMRRVADMTGQVLEGTKPSDIPFYEATKYELVLNQKTAASLALKFPPTLLTTADDVIE
jgi:putative tryptophan/tyrosine transport system substrate-binding protein